MISSDRLMLQADIAVVLQDDPLMTSATSHLSNPNMIYINTHIVLCKNVKEGLNA
jgi:hypothetical protein